MLVFGVGIGIFLIFVTGLLLIFLCMMSIPCSKSQKIVVRFIGAVLYLALILILLLADRSSNSTSSSSSATTTTEDVIYSNSKREVYDESIVPRISMIFVGAFFCLIALVGVLQNCFQSKELSSVDQDIHTLWQN